MYQLTARNVAFKCCRAEWINIPIYRSLLSRYGLFLVDTLIAVALNTADRVDIYFSIAGYYAYLCLITVINAHDHPVAKVFVQCLMDNVKDKRKSDPLEFSNFG